MVPPFKHFPFAIRLLLLFCVTFTNTVAVAMIAAYLAHSIFGIDVARQINGPADVTPADFYGNLFFQAIGTIGMFALSALMFSVLQAGEFKSHLRLRHFPPGKMILLGIVAVCIAQFIIPFLVYVNSSIPLPESLAFLRKAAEINSQKEQMLTSFNSIGDLVIVSLVMAFLPALCEELFFRGLLLGDFLKANISAALSIAITGFIFAAVHGRFENMLAIWALGSFLGYLYVVSGTVWLPVIVHFTNNALAVFFKYLYNTGAIGFNADTARPSVYIVLAALVAMAGCIYLFNKWKVYPFYKQPDYFSDQPEQ